MKAALARHGDFLIVGILTLISGATLSQSDSSTSMIVALPFVLICPGYSLLAAVFSRRSDLDAWSRLALSFGLSLSLVSVLGLAVESIVGFGRWGIFSAMVMINLFGALIAIYRRSQVRFGERYRFNFPSRRLSSVFVLVGITMSAVLLIDSVDHVAEPPSAGFTVFYVLDSSGSPESYPSFVEIGNEVALVVGIENHEGVESGYRIEVSLGNVKLTEDIELSLRNGQVEKLPIAVRPIAVGEGQRLEIRLFKQSSLEAYRSLRLFLDVLPQT